MRLTQLDPQFLKAIDSRSLKHVDDLSQADGVLLHCPKCFVTNGGPIGTHSIICWKPHVPQTVTPKGGRWKFDGTGYADLTLSPSILIKDDCGAHFFIRNGEII